MGWKEWLAMVGHLTLPQLRCDVPPTPEILEMIEVVGADEWERNVKRLERRNANA